MSNWDESFLLDLGVSVWETPKMNSKLSFVQSCSRYLYGKISRISYKFETFLSTIESIRSWTGTFWKTGCPDNRIAFWKSEWSYSSERWSRRRTQIASRRTRLFFIILGLFRSCLNELILKLRYHKSYWRGSEELGTKIVMLCRICKRTCAETKASWRLFQRRKSTIISGNSWTSKIRAKINHLEFSRCSQIKSATAQTTGEFRNRRRHRNLRFLVGTSS